MQLFYNPEINSSNQEFTFDKTESRHIVRVLRKKDGDTILITNGLGTLFTSKIIIANDKRCLVKITNIEAKTKPWNYYLHIVIAPTKLNDRFEWFLEKATEIGIDEITPIICDHSERKVLKLDRMEKIVHSAAKQSLKFHFPKLNQAIPFNDFINADLSGDLYIAHCEETDKKSLKFLVAFSSTSIKASLTYKAKLDISSSGLDTALSTKVLKPKPAGSGVSPTITLARVFSSLI